jgi:hypothetical protein
MPFWRNTNPKARLSSRRRSGRLLGRALFLSITMTIISATQETQHRPATKKAAAQRANELTLAGLRPGRDKLGRAVQLFAPIDPKSVTNDSQTIWLDACCKQSLSIDFDSSKKIQVIRAGVATATTTCPTVSAAPWKTGLGLRLDDPVPKVPSTKNGQPLELWYYQFDRAGPVVPMEILCTRAKDGQPRRVIEITLAAASL